MMKTPLVSVITPVYNSAATLTECIRSVQSQRFQEWEHILVDDASTDESASILSHLAAEDERIIPLALSTNGGAARARNKAIQHARGRYLAFLDSDDLWVPEKLEKQLAFMKTHKAALSHTSYQFMDADGKPMQKVIHAKERIDYHRMLDTNYIGCLTAMVDTHQTGKMLMPDIRKRQDYAYWLSIMRAGFEAYGLDENLAFYRIGKESLSSNKWKAAQYNYKLLTDIEGLSKSKALLHMFRYIYLSVKKHYLDR
jgi:teichuronic acid biosynthesis glycosyltransferase TuaG